MERLMTVSDLLDMRNALAEEQQELYLAALTNINMRYRELLTSDFGSILVKNCAWDAADVLVGRYFSTQDFYISPQQMYERICSFSYDNEIDPLTDNAGIRKMLSENDNTSEVLNDIEEKCAEAQKKLFEKHTVTRKNGKTSKEYIYQSKIEEGKDKYRKAQGENIHDELTGKPQTQESKDEVDHVQALATAKYNSRYLKDKGIQKLKEVYNSADNFQMLNQTANRSKGDVQVFSDGHTVISGKTLVKERNELTDKLRREIQSKEGLSQSEARKKARRQAEKIIDNKYHDITYKATAQQQAQAICDRWENSSSSAKENLTSSGILDENGKVKPEVRLNLEKNLRESMNAESKVILENTDYKEVAKDAKKYTKASVKKIIIGQVVYYVLPPLVFETRTLVRKTKMTLDKFLREIKKSGSRIVHYVTGKIGDIIKNVAGNSLNKFLKTFFDIIIEIVKETVKRIIKVIKQLVLALVNCVKIIANKNATPAQKADSVSKIMSVTVSTVVIEILFEWMEKQFGLPDILMEPLQIIVTILVTNIIMLILQKADLFDVQYGLLISNIQVIFEQENQKYLEESDRLNQKGEKEAGEYMDVLHEQIAEIENDLIGFDPYEDDACIELDKINEVYHMGIDFKQEWIDFCQGYLVVGGC